MIDPTEVMPGEVHVTIEIEEHSFGIILDYARVEDWAFHTNQLKGDDSRSDVAGLLYEEIEYRLKHMGVM